MIRARAVAVLALLLAGCTASPQVVEPTPLCPGSLAAMDVYNYYADHPIADHQRITAGLDDICRDLLSFSGLEERAFEADELAQRGVTVLVMWLPDGSSHTVWAHAWPGRGTAILDSDGGSWFVTGPPVYQYYGPDSVVVDRDEVPER